MITLITGTPGSGKTLYAVTRLIKEINENPDREVYADITGLKIEGVHQSPDDWRDTPEGSLIIYDECQYREMFKRGRGANAHSAVLDLTTHRHTGKDIWLITQTPAYLHKDVLAVVGEHYHLDRPMGAKLANLYRYRQAEEKPGGSSVKQRAESRTMFKYNKEVFDYYDSVDVTDENANHKGLKIPIWKILPLIVGIVFLLYAFYGIVFGGGVKPNSTKEKDKQTVEQVANASQDTPLLPGVAIQSKGQTEQQTPEQAQDITQTESRRIYLYDNELPKDYVIRRTDPYLQVRGVAMMGNKCQAYNAMGDMMNLTQDECKSYVGTGRVYKTDYGTATPTAHTTQGTQYTQQEIAKPQAFLLQDNEQGQDSEPPQEQPSQQPNHTI